MLYAYWHHPYRGPNNIYTRISRHFTVWRPSNRCQNVLTDFHCALDCSTRKASNNMPNATNSYNGLCFVGTKASLFLPIIN